MKDADYWNRESRRTPKERADEVLGIVLGALMPTLPVPKIRPQDEPHVITHDDQGDDLT